MYSGRRKLCVCIVNGCNRHRTTNPLTGKPVAGIYLPISTHCRHQREQANSQIVSDSDYHETSATSTSIPVSHASQESESRWNLHLSREDNIYEAKVMESDIQLQNYKTLIQETIDSIETPELSGLKFKSKPSLDSSFESFSESVAWRPDDPIFDLTLRHPANDRLQYAKACLINIFQSLEDVQAYGKESLLISKIEARKRIMNGLSRIHSIKAIEWEYQARMNYHKERAEINEPYLVLTEDYRKAQDMLKTLSPTIMLSLLLAVILHNLCHVFREQSNFVLVMLQSINAFALKGPNRNQFQQPAESSKIPKDIRTAEKMFNLSPVLIKYVSCPSCRKLYHPDEIDSSQGVPERCNYQEYPNGPLCGTEIWRSQYIKGRAYLTPHLSFHVQEFHSWLGKLLSQEGMVDLLRQPMENLHKGSSAMINRDIWDGRLVSSFKDNVGNPFFRYTGPELRLLFGFGYDGFNPFHIKAAGKKGSVGVIFLFCYNLPPERRLRPENVFIMGVIPGLKHPSLTQTNHYIRPLIDIFLKFYDPGFLMWGVPNYRDGLLTKGALWPVVMDSLAARQILGLASITHTFFCFCCLTNGDEISNTVPEEWKAWHSPAEHRRIAQKWKMALTTTERDAIFDKYGI